MSTPPVISMTSVPVPETDSVWLEPPPVILTAPCQSPVYCTRTASFGTSGSGVLTESVSASEPASEPPKDELEPVVSAGTAINPPVTPATKISTETNRTPPTTATLTPLERVRPKRVPMPARTLGMARRPASSIKPLATQSATPANGLRKTNPSPRSPPNSVNVPATTATIQAPICLLELSTLNIVRGTRKVVPASLYRGNGRTERATRSRFRATPRQGVPVVLPPLVDSIWGRGSSKPLPSRVCRERT
jgi:hypothetical protein